MLIIRYVYVNVLYVCHRGICFLFNLSYEIFCVECVSSAVLSSQISWIDLKIISIQTFHFEGIAGNCKD